MVRVTDYEARRNEIFSAAINTYINTASPVSSEELSQFFGYSSATIRNILAELEELNLLTHPYTSAGRIPTDEGYRYYIERLMTPMQLEDRERDLIEEEYKRENKDLDDLFQLTSQVLSNLSHSPGMVSFLEYQNKLFYEGTSYILEEPEFRDLERVKFLLKAFEKKENLIKLINQELEGKIRIFIGKELGCQEIDNCSLVVSTYNFKGRPSGRLAILGPRRMKYNRIISLVEYLSDVLSTILDKLQF